MKKNKRVIILLSVLILGIGVSLAYFVGKTIFSGTGATTEGRTATVNGSTLDISGNIDFGDVDIYPGHQTLSKVTATATGNNELIAYNLTWVGTNNLNTNLKYKVYVSDIEKEISLTCEKKKKVVNGAQQLNEVCTINGELGEPINEGEIPKTTEEQTIKITDTEFITSKEEGATKYYYIIVEYPDSGDQSIDIGEGFKGKAYGEISNTKADVNILGYFIKNEDTGKYEEATEMPDNHYIINTEESKCTNGAEVSTNEEDNSVNIKGLTIEGTSCYLYYDKIKSASEKTLVALKLDSKGSLGNSFTGNACALNTNNINHNADDTSEGSCKETNQNGIYEAKDDYGVSYYFRGTINNNWVKIGNMYWRIIRINGNGTIRVIYSGIVKPSDGRWAIGEEANAVSDVEFNAEDRDNKYVGFMYGTQSNSYENAHQNDISSDIMNTIKTWYEGNGKGLQNYKKYLDGATGFCNDRQINEKEEKWWNDETTFEKRGFGTNSTAYAPFHRLYTTNSGEGTPSNIQSPTLKCGNKIRDLYTTKDEKGEGNGALSIPIGLITIDEMIYAGGFAGKSNYGYWLYTGDYYWSMSPKFYRSGALMFGIHENGRTVSYYTYQKVQGLRPVINLKADISITGSGTIDSPYEISLATDSFE